MNNKLSSLSAVIGAAFVTSVALSPVASAADASFAANNLQAGYTLADNMEGKCGEAKCGADHKDKKAEAKCGADKKAEGKCGADKKAEGSCGADKKAEGKCGADKKAEGSCGADKKAEGKCGADKKAE